MASDTPISYDVLLNILVASGNPNIFRFNKGVRKDLTTLLDTDDRSMLMFLVGRYGVRPIVFKIWSFMYGKQAYSFCKKLPQYVIRFLKKLASKNQAIVQWLLEYCMNISRNNRILITWLLMYAIRFNQFDLVRVTITNYKDKLKYNSLEEVLTESDLCLHYNQTCFDAAIINKVPFDILELFVKVGGVNPTHTFFTTLFTRTVYDSSYIQTCDYLVKLGADVNDPDLLYLFYLEEVELCDLHPITQFQYLFDKGADPTKVLVGIWPAKPKYTLVYQTREDGSINYQKCVLEECVDRGADLNYNKGQLLLEYIKDPWDEYIDVREDQGIESTLSYLIRRGLDIKNVPFNPLRVAIQSYGKTNIEDIDDVRVDVIQTLLDNGIQGIVL